MRRSAKLVLLLLASAPVRCAGALPRRARRRRRHLARGRGWALCTGLVALPYYKETNPIFAENARYRIGEVLAD